MKLNREFLIERAVQRSIDYHINEMELEIESIPERCEVQCSPMYGALEEDRIWRACHRAFYHHQHGVALNEILEEITQ